MTHLVLQEACDEPKFKVGVHCTSIEPLVQGTALGRQSPVHRLIMKFEHWHQKAVRQAFTRHTIPGNHLLHSCHDHYTRDLSRENVCSWAHLSRAQHNLVLLGRARCRRELSRANWQSWPLRQGSAAYRSSAGDTELGRAHNLALQIQTKSGVAHGLTHMTAAIYTAGRTHQQILTQGHEQKAEEFTCFSQPTRLIACATQQQ